MAKVKFVEAATDFLYCYSLHYIVLLVLCWEKSAYVKIASPNFVLLLLDTCTYLLHLTGVSVSTELSPSLFYRLIFRFSWLVWSNWFGWIAAHWRNWTLRVRSVVDNLSLNILKHASPSIKHVCFFSYLFHFIYFRSSVYLMLCF